MLRDTDSLGELELELLEEEKEDLQAQDIILQNIRESNEIFKATFTENPEEERLRKQEVAGSEHMTSGCADVLKVTLVDGSKAVFKDKEQEKKYEGKLAEPGNYFLHERAAYLVDRALDLNLVPPTVIRKIGDQLGSFQKFVEGEEYYHVAQPYANREEYDKIAELDNHYKNDFIQLWLLDYVLWSADRTHRNIMLDGQKIHAIDNALSMLHTEEAVYFDDYYNQEIPENIREKLVNFGQDPTKQEALKNTLEKLLGIEGSLCIDRLNNLVHILTEEDHISLEKYGTLRQGGDNYEKSHNHQD